MRELYGSAIGRGKYEVITPALIVEPAKVRRNLATMAARLPGLHARLRGHVKNHKSPHIARMQLEYGAFGLCAATVWEAIVMVRAGADDVLIANQLVTPQKRRAAALLAREATILVNVDDIADAAALSMAAVTAGTTIGILVEVDTGMHRAGVDSPDEALAVARRVTELPGLRMDGLSGYEGHCSMEMDHEAGTPSRRSPSRTSWRSPTTSRRRASRAPSCRQPAPRPPSGPALTRASPSSSSAPMRRWTTTTT